MALSQKNLTNSFFLNISLFRIVYIVTLFFCSFYFIGAAAVVLKYVLMTWAVCLLYVYYIRSRRMYNVLYSRWLFAFIVSAFLTALIHVVDNFFPNMVMLLHIIICFFVFYGMHTEKNKRRIRREIYYIAAIIVIAATVLAVAGIIMIFITGKIRIEQFDYDIIIYENRFTGFYTNPNLLGFYSVVAVFCAHILSKRDFISECGKKPVPNFLLIITVIINVFSLFISDSNASLVLLILYVLANLFFKAYSNLQTLSLKKIVLRGLALIGCLVFLFSSFFVVRWGTNLGFAAIINSNEQVITPSSPSSVKEEIKESPAITFEHINKNIDSGRLRLLTESAVLIGNYPLFGIGKENLVEYGQRYIEGGLHFSDLHNGYLTILVSSGFVGLIIFIGFALHVARHCIKSLFLEKRNLKNSIFPCLFSFIAAYCVYSVSEKTLLYEQTFMVVFFWLVLGYASCYMNKFNHINDKFEFTNLFKKKSEETLNLIDIPTDD